MQYLLDMVPKTLLLCLVFAVCASGIAGQVASLCRPNERLLPCGCPKTCRDPVPDCKGVCRMGCYCEEGEVRNDTGHCIKLADCPPMAAYKLDTTEPRDNGGICADDEEYRFCEPCNKTCANPNPMCRAQCARGCFCKDGLLRDIDGRCVKLEKCSKAVKQQKENVNLIKPIPYAITCGKHQIYKPCEACERTCSKPSLTCQSSCESGCFCLDGYVKAPNGECVKLAECPKAEVTLGGARGPSIEDCSSDEEYLSCGWCEPSCSEPAPSCPVGVCTRGCLCRPPLLRHRSGHCVQEKDCSPHKCKDSNEEYVCRYGCEPSCSKQVCIGHARPRRCTLACHCRLGLLRDIPTGLCVPPAMCDTYINKSYINESIKS